MTDGGYGGGPAATSGGDPFGAGPFAGDPFAVGEPSAGAARVPTPTSQQQETNTLATLSQIHETGDRGRDRALVGVTLSYVFITAVVVALIVAAAGVQAR